MKKTTLVLVLTASVTALGFSPLATSRPLQSVAVSAIKKKAKVAPTKTAGGFGCAAKDSAAAPPPARPKELLARSEKLFEELERFYAKAIDSNDEESSDDDEDDTEREAASYSMRQYVLCARLKGEEARARATGPSVALTDWVPVNIMLFLGPRGFEANEVFLATASATFAKECHYTLTTYVPSLSKVAASMLEYGAEELSSFEKHVYPYYGEDGDGVNRSGFY